MKTVPNCLAVKQREAVLVKLLTNLQSQVG